MSLQTGVLIWAVLFSPTNPPSHHEFLLACSTENNTTHMTSVTRQILQGAASSHPQHRCRGGMGGRGEEKAVTACASRLFQ